MSSAPIMRIPMTTVTAVRTAMTLFISCAFVPVARAKVRSFVVNKLLGQARQFTIDQLIRCVERCVELEEAVKRGNMNERIAVEMVLLSIANREYHA